MVFLKLTNYFNKFYIVKWWAVHCIVNWSYGGSCTTLGLSFGWWKSICNTQIFYLINALFSKYPYLTTLTFNLIIEIFNSSLLINHLGSNLHISRKVFVWLICLWLVSHTQVHSRCLDYLNSPVYQEILAERAARELLRKLRRLTSLV